ncbi:hypothetical protein [Kutzneria chonburiensis]|uniref:Uncharacterized protein n=1 Tax=Kutzneria chonburiensis TaxID=1483604 RepID=A0ABV6N8I6_9PSEU|nr:hypothetical protein [Kutzneria chonburiensis]
MWGMIFGLAELVSFVALAAILIRMTVVLRRHGMRLFAFEPWKTVSRSDWRRMMRALRRGEPVPVELLGVAREWARRQVLIRIQVWVPVALIPLLASGLRADLVDPSLWGQVSFWLAIVVMVVMVPAALQTWRDNQAAARLLRDTAPTA